MLSSGFTYAPVSRFLFFGTISSSLLASIADVKPYFHTPTFPILWRHSQLWRLLIWQGCYTNSSDLLFAMMLLYHLRVIERLWGSKKFASFLTSVYLPLTILTPLLHTILNPPLLYSLPAFLPAGPTPLLFALLAQYHAAIPTVYKYHILTSSSTSSTSNNLSQPSSSSSAPASSSSQPPAPPKPQQDPQPTVTFSDKTLTYLLALQLSLTSVPLTLLLATTGYVIGFAWREGWGPAWWSSWRVPGWAIGETKRRGGRGAGAGAEEGFEGLRRRLEGEGRGSGVQGSSNNGPEGGGSQDAAADGSGGGQGVRRRGIGGGVLGAFRGAF